MDLSLRCWRRENPWREQGDCILRLPAKKPVVDMQLGGLVKTRSRRHGRNPVLSVSARSSAGPSAPTSGLTTPPTPPPRYRHGSTPRPPIRPEQLLGLGSPPVPVLPLKRVFPTRSPKPAQAVVPPHRPRDGLPTADILRPRTAGEGPGEWGTFTRVVPACPGEGGLF